MSPLTTLLHAILLQLHPVADHTGWEIAAFDTPNDGGESITVTWSDPGLVGTQGYDILRAVSPEGPFDVVGSVPSTRGEYLDQKGISDGTAYYYRLRAVGPDSLSAPSASAVSSAQWFNRGRVSILIAVTTFAGLILWFTYHARRGKKLFIRRIAGLEAVEEAVGRATEMGRPILYIPGLSTMDDVATIASMSILSQVARKAGEYATRLMIPNRDPVVMTVAQEVVKESYLSIGRPDLYSEDDVFYMTYSQFGYAAGVSGLMLRERPATNFFLGMFWAESLILAETGYSTGAIQIAGTDADAQLPFFVTACDYTLIGEELYAAGVYLSREPLLMGSLKGQDAAKFLIIAGVIIGTVMALLGQQWFATIFQVAE
jgi:hypothetical protein